MSGIIIEGVCASGKTIIFNSISKRNWYLEKKTKIQLSEYLTERIMEKTNPTVDKRVELLNEYVDIFEKVYYNFYNSRFKNTKSPRVKPFFLVERFHLTHSIECKNFEPFKEIDLRLNKMNFKLIVLTMKKEVIKERILDTFPRRPETWKKYCLSFGGIDGAVDKYAKMQAKLLEFTELTSIPVKVIDTTCQDWSNSILQVESFLLK